MAKKIWLINPFAMPPKYELRIQTLKRAQYLQEYGYDVTIFCGSYLHNTDINLIKDKRKYDIQYYNGIKHVHIRTISYKGNGLRRFYNLFEFSLRFLFLAKKFKRPDYIAQLATVPFGNIIYYLAKHYNAWYIVDVVDLWPESFVSYGLISKKNPILKFAYYAEKWLYERADEIVFSMEGGKDYIIEKGWDKNSGGKIDLSKVHYINNGVDLKDFYENKEKYRIDDIDLKNDKTFKVTYLGSIRLANNVMKFVEAAERLKDFEDIQFLIYGDGDDRIHLESYCKNNNVKNVIFKQKWVELKYVPYILSKSSLNILNYMPSSVDKYGGSQSKSFQYMASGKPILCNLKMGYCPITRYNLGLAREFIDAKEYADAILEFYYMDKNKYNEICENNINASRNYDYKKLTADFVKLVLK